MSNHADNVGRAIAAIGDVSAGILTAGAYFGHFANFSDLAAAMAICWYVYSFVHVVIGWVRRPSSNKRADS